MDCRKLSVDACMHAVQNERLPLRVVVQVLFFEQIRAASSGNAPTEIPGSLKALLPDRSHGSSRSTTTNTDEELDAVATAEDIKALKSELATLRLSQGVSDRIDNSAKNDPDRADLNKTKGSLKSKIFSKLWSSKDKHGDTSGSEASESTISTNAEEIKSTSSRSKRH